MKKTTLALLLLGAMGCEDCKARDALFGGAREEAAVSTPSAEATDGFFRSLLEAAMSGDASEVDALIDWNAVATRAVRGLSVSSEAKRELAEGASKAAAEHGLAAHLAGMSRGDVTLQRLASRDRAGERWEIVRLTTADGGFEHLGFLLSTQGDGTRAVDLWQLTLGDSASEMMRRMILPTLPDPAGLSETEREIAANAGALAEAERLAAEGHGHDALHRLDLLPDILQDERFVMLTRLSYAEGASKKEHLGELEAIAETFPSDPTVALHLIDAHVIQGQLERALEAVDHLEASIVRDPYLDVIRANILGAMDRWADAKAASERVIALEPDLEAAYWPALVGSAIAGEYADTTRLLLTMRNKFGTSLDLQALPVYVDYVASPEYQEYLKAISE